MRRPTCIYEYNDTACTKEVDGWCSRYCYDHQPYLYESCQYKTSETTTCCQLLPRSRFPFCEQHRFCVDSSLIPDPYTIPLLHLLTLGLISSFIPLGLFLLLFFSHSVFTYILLPVFILGWFRIWFYINHNLRIDHETNWVHEIPYEPSQV